MPGHRAGDLLLGRHWTPRATRVERTTRCTVLVQRAGHDHGARRERRRPPPRPWQRGTHENTNRLLRQDFPTDVSMKDLTQAARNQVAAKLSARPRKTLDVNTPAARFEILLR